VIVGEGGQLFAVIDREHIAPGNWRAILNLKLRNLKTGAVAVNRVKTDDKVEVAYLDHRHMQYLYEDRDGYVFMDNETSDQVTLARDVVAEQMKFLKENENVQVVFYDGKPISLELPRSVELKVVETEPSVKGATAAAQDKPATLETGARIKVPPFIAVGDVIQVDPEEERYIGRVK
jgi:elongation factor P